MVDASPSARIIADLRRRITSGQLRPGDRVPSTREIVQEWGVAHATASKALGLLRDEGLIVTRSRVGAVVAGKQVAHQRRGAVVDLGHVVRTAIEIADAEGMAALTMRTIAARLGVAAMTPYHYVRSKQELVVLMADSVFGELTPTGDEQDWRTRLDIGARTLWTLYRRHTWLAQLGSLSRPLPLPNVAGHSEWTLRALLDAGLDPVTAFNHHLVLHSFVHGVAVNLERELHAESTSGLSGEQWFDKQAPSLTAISMRHPAFAAVAAQLRATGHRFDLDELFELGLRRMLDGISALAS